MAKSSRSNSTLAAAAIAAGTEEGPASLDWTPSQSLSLAAIAWSMCKKIFIRSMKILREASTY